MRWFCTGGPATVGRLALHDCVPRGGHDSDMFPQAISGGSGRNPCRADPAVFQSPAVPGPFDHIRCAPSFCGPAFRGLDRGKRLCPWRHRRCHRRKIRMPRPRARGQPCTSVFAGLNGAGPRVRPVSGASADRRAARAIFGSDPAPCDAVAIRRAIITIVETSSRFHARNPNATLRHCLRIPGRTGYARRILPRRSPPCPPEAPIRCRVPWNRTGSNR